MYAITTNHSLLPYNTFGINISSKYFTIINNINDFQLFIKNDIKKFDKVIVLGGGSNILFTKDIDGLTVKNEMQGIQITDEDENYVWLQVMSGTEWHDVVRYAVSHGYGGIENLALIPGTAGAAPIQNIGAYGCEIKDVLTDVSALHLESGEPVNFSNTQCHFAYRDSIFKRSAKGQYFITSIRLKLDKKPTLNTRYGDISKILNERNILQPTIADVAEAVIFIRNSKLPHPDVLGNAGSFFKNPVISQEQLLHIQKTYADVPHYPTSDNRCKVPAAWIIEQCGWKGKVVGNTGNHKGQPLVLVNYGNASGTEILNHAITVQNSVFNTFGINLEMEVNIL